MLFTTTIIKVITQNKVVFTIGCLLLHYDTTSHYNQGEPPITVIIMRKRCMPCGATLPF